MNIIEELIMCSVGAVFFLAAIFVVIILSHVKNDNKNGSSLINK